MSFQPVIESYLHLDRWVCALPFPYVCRWDISCLDILDLSTSRPGPWFRRILCAVLTSTSCTCRTWKSWPSPDTSSPLLRNVPAATSLCQSTAFGLVPCLCGIELARIHHLWSYVPKWLRRCLLGVKSGSGCWCVLSLRLCPLCCIHNWAVGSVTTGARGDTCPYIQLRVGI